MKKFFKISLIMTLFFVLGINDSFAVTQGDQINSSLLSRDKHFNLICPESSEKNNNDELITRGEFVKLIFCDNQEVPKEFLEDIKIDFKDLSGNENFISELKLAVFLNGIKGFQDNTFRPNNAVTLEEALKIIFSIRDNIEKTLFGEYVSTLEKLADNEDWAEFYISRAKELNLYNAEKIRKGQKLKKSELKEIVFRLDVIERTSSLVFKEELLDSVDYLTFFVNKNEKKYLKDFSDTLGILRSYYLYPDELSDQEPYNASTFAFVESLKDQYTNVYQASEYLDSPVLPDQVDLGFSIKSKNLDNQDFYYFVGDIKSNSVPYQLGLRRNFIIEELMIGGVSEFDFLNEDENLDSLKYVTIVFRSSLSSLYETEINFPIVVKDNSLVNGELKDDLIYLRIRLFDEKTESEFTTLTQQLSRNDLTNLKGYVLDLRGNPGGAVDTLMKLSEYLFEAGTTIFQYTDNLKKQHEVKTKVDPENSEVWRKNVPWVILIDGNSASASEVLANALIDLKANTKVVGQPSYGKGKMQVTFGIKQDSFVLAVTMAELSSPKGRKIDQIKLAPEILIDHGDNFLNFDRDKDLAIKKAKQLF